MTKKNVLVTGGAGYVGSVTCEYLKRNGDRVTCLDKDVSPVPGIESVICDITNSNHLRDEVSGRNFDSVVHLAGVKNVGESMVNPLLYLETNVQGTANLCRWLPESVERLVFSSSCSIYGNPKEVPVTEETSPDPQSVYAWSKYFAEFVISGWCAGSQTKTAVSLRYFNAAGADETTGLAEPISSKNLIPTIFRALQEEQEVEVFGTRFDTDDGFQERDFIDVRDIAVAHSRALELQMVDSFIAINLGTGFATSVGRIIEEIQSITGTQVEINDVGPRQGDPVRIYANNGLAKSVLNWEPIHDLGSMIQASARAYSSSGMRYSE